LKVDLDVERHLVSIEGEKLGLGKDLGSVGVAISPKWADRRDGQLLLWMTCNLLCRLKEVVGEIELSIPRDSKLLEWVVPFGGGKLLFAEAVFVGGNLAARGCQVTLSEGSDLRRSHDAIVLVGDDTNTTAVGGFVVRTASDGWLGFVGEESWKPKVGESDSKNPLGAFSAACIAVGDVFKHLGAMNETFGSYAKKLCFSSYELKTFDLSSGAAPYAANPELPGTLDLGRLQVAGSGAVAHGFSHAVYSTVGAVGKLVYIDRRVNSHGKQEFIESTNLNRYILASNRDVGVAKGGYLAGVMASKPGTEATGFDDSLETYVSGGESELQNVLSCVDNNASRHVIQEQLPRTMLGASTNEMEIQLSLYDLAIGTQCLKCNNPKEYDLAETDQQVIDRLRVLSPSEQEVEARKASLDPAVLKAYLENPNCGLLGGDSLRRLGRGESSPSFSVGFVSAMSGMMLAGEVIRVACRDSGLEPALGRGPTDYFMNFWYDSCSLNRTLPSESCWCNAPIGKRTPRQIFADVWNLSVP